MALVSLAGSLAALACGSLLARQHPVLALIPALALGGPSVWGWWCVWRAARDKSPLPRPHSLLAGTLGFDLACTVRDVAVAAFFLDDRVPSGGVTRLLVFLENYASRRRIVLMRIGRHQGLGLPQDQDLALHLLPGEAAVYALPLRVSKDSAAGHHALPLTIRVRRPRGNGVRLPGARRHLYNIWCYHYTVPFEVWRCPLADAPGRQPLPAPSYLVLASPGREQPRLEALQRIVNGIGGVHASV